MKIFDALKSAIAGIVGLCALAAVPVACIVVMSVAPERSIHNARQTGLHPAQIEHWIR